MSRNHDYPWGRVQDIAAYLNVSERKAGEIHRALYEAWSDGFDDGFQDGYATGVYEYE